MLTFAHSVVIMIRIFSEYLTSHTPLLCFYPLRTSGLSARTSLEPVTLCEENRYADYCTTSGPFQLPKLYLFFVWSHLSPPGDQKSNQILMTGRSLREEMVFPFTNRIAWDTFIICSCTFARALIVASYAGNIPCPFTFSPHKINHFFT